MPAGVTATVTAAAERVPLLQFAAAQELERRLLAAAAARGSGCSWAVWRTHQSLVVPSQTTNAANFHIASLDMSLRGWPVYVRDTGGDVTPQSPGTINASAAFVVPRTPDLSIRATYQSFCAPLLTFLGTLGIEAYLSSVRGAFCDGAFNIVVDGRKLAGTAQRWRLTQTSDGSPGVAVLAHAAILADPDIELSIAATNRFYRLCGEDREVDPGRHTSLVTLLGSSQAGAERLSQSLRDFLERE
ncbi:hypothetical protein [Hyphomicrobium sp.]|uniref:lipoate--protein ligase family protein n=1 Tax=Hyphomicrobium sp. TaxID=82 RepID=UPI0025C66DF7|nr:hypothetical protein [Hyphomicrobium sp.]MCC7253681.1 hypothetical protein [Hyphomicrobium sp.]